MRYRARVLIKTGPTTTNKSVQTALPQVFGSDIGSLKKWADALMFSSPEITTVVIEEIQWTEVERLTQPPR